MWAMLFASALVGMPCPPVDRANDREHAAAITNGVADDLGRESVPTVMDS